MNGLARHNVQDSRFGWIGSWETAPLVYDALTPDDVGRTVIYYDSGRPYFNRAEAGTLTSWRDGTIFARFSQGDTAAGCNPSDLVFGVIPLDGDLSRARALLAERSKQ